MRILLENILRQYADILNGKLVYIYSGKELSMELYQDLLDGDIKYFYNEYLTDVSQLDKNDLVRLTSRYKHISRFNKSIKTRRFVPTFKRDDDKYNDKGLFAFEHKMFIVINYDYLLRKKKIDKLIEIIK